MEHLLSCGCGRKIPVLRSQAGQELTCECGQRLQVPTLRGFADLPTAQAAAIPAASEARRAWGGWRGTIMALSLAVFVLFALPCAYFVFIRTQIDTSYTIETELAAGNANYDSFSIEQLAAEWSNFEKNGLGPKEKPWFFTLNLIAREQEILAAVTGAIATLAGLTALGVGLTRPKHPQ
jgi:hypothetical protein